MHSAPRIVFHESFSTVDISSRSSITKIDVFLLAEQTQAKNRPNGNFLVQTFQKQSLSRPKTSLASSLETPVWHLEPIQVQSDLKPALSLSRDKATLHRQQGSCHLDPTLLLALKKRIFALALLPEEAELTHSPFTTG